MQKWKEYIPHSTKVFLKRNLRRLKDILKGDHKRFARRSSITNENFPLIAIDQPIRSRDSVANKIHNLSIAIKRLNNIAVAPGQVFSFWQLVGDPSQKNGYLKSRSIVGNILQEETGGGLCQLSGLIYFLALHGGLTITERHAHSLDIYTEAERFTPLGSDATVSYGYKDLRFLNPHTFVVCFSFQLTETVLRGIISSAEKREPCTIEFEYSKDDPYTDVTTISKFNGEAVVMNRSRYRSHSVAKPVA